MYNSLDNNRKSMKSKASHYNRKGMGSAASHYGSLYDLYSFIALLYRS